MIRKQNLTSLILVCAIGACTDDAEHPPICTFGTTPSTKFDLKLPNRLHNEFSGEAKVAFVIDASGKVNLPVIVSSKWHSIGRSRGQPVGYHEAILAMVVQWQYPQRQTACRHQIPIKIQFLSETGTGRDKASFEKLD
jgi:hypothetical protein